MSYWYWLYFAGETSFVRYVFNVAIKIVSSMVNKVCILRRAFLKNRHERARLQVYYKYLAFNHAALNSLTPMEYK